MLSIASAMRVRTCLTAAISSHRRVVLLSMAAFMSLDNPRISSLVEAASLTCRATRALSSSWRCRIRLMLSSAALPLLLLGAACCMWPTSGELATGLNDPSIKSPACTSWMLPLDVLHGLWSGDSWVLGVRCPSGVGHGSSTSLIGAVAAASPTELLAADGVPSGTGS